MITAQEAMNKLPIYIEFQEKVVLSTWKTTYLHTYILQHCRDYLESTSYILQTLLMATVLY